MKVIKSILSFLAVLLLLLSVYLIIPQKAALGGAKFGTYEKPGDEQKCPGKKSNCVIVTP